MKPTKKIALLALALLSLTAVTHSSFAQENEVYSRNWPTWRGPTGNGVALQGNPPTEWSESRNVKWKVAVPGLGHGTPIVWEDKVFVMTAVPGDGDAYDFKTIAFNRDNGEIDWEKLAKSEVPHEGGHATNSQSSASPITDGEHVISFFGSRGLYCYDMEGNLVWSKDLGRMRTLLNFGEGASPALHGDVLVVVWDTEDDSFLYAFNKNTGEQLWKTPRDESTTWNTPRILQHEGKLQVIVSATNAVRAYDLATGQQIWECAGQVRNVIPSIVADEDTVYAMSGFQGSSAMAIELGHTGNISNSDAVRWKISRGTPYVPSPLLYGDNLYFLQGHNGIMSAVNKDTGEVLFSQERIVGLSGVYASPVGVDDRIYLPGQNGTTVVLDRSEDLSILATNSLDDSFDASPAVVGNEIFLRGHDYLYCIAED